LLLTNDANTQPAIPHPPTLQAQSIAEASFLDLEKRVEEAVAMEVAEGTRALASELDEAYDRSDELGKEVENEMMKMDGIRQE